MSVIGDKRWIVIPVDIRKGSEIAPGEKLMVLRRRGGSGTPLVKLIVMGDLMRGMWNMNTSSQK